jgi:hypothetical protein
MKPKGWKVGVGGLGGGVLMYDYVHFASPPGGLGDLGYHLYTTVPFKAHEEVKFGYQFQGIVGAIEHGILLPSPSPPPGKALNFILKSFTLHTPGGVHLIDRYPVPVANVLKLTAPTGTVPLFRYHVCFDDGEGKTKFASFIYTIQRYPYIAFTTHFKYLKMLPDRPNLNRPLWLADSEASRLIIESPLDNDAACSVEAH